MVVPDLEGRQYYCEAIFTTFWDFLVFLGSRYDFPWAWDWSWKIHVNLLNFYVHVRFLFQSKSYKQAVNGVIWQESKMLQSSYKTVYKPVILGSIHMQAHFDYKIRHAHLAQV